MEQFIGRRVSFHGYLYATNPQVFNGVVVDQHPDKRKICRLVIKPDAPVFGYDGLVERYHSTETYKKDDYRQIEDVTFL